jgi:hypothetical protein
MMTTSKNRNTYLPHPFAKIADFFGRAGAKMAVLSRAWYMEIVAT